MDLAQYVDLMRKKMRKRPSSMWTMKKKTMMTMTTRKAKRMLKAVAVEEEALP